VRFRCTVRANARSTVSQPLGSSAARPVDTSLKRKPKECPARTSLLVCFTHPTSTHVACDKQWSTVSQRAWQQRSRSGRNRYNIERNRVDREQDDGWRTPHRRLGGSCLESIRQRAGTIQVWECAIQIKVVAEHSAHHIQPVGNTAAQCTTSRTKAGPFINRISKSGRIWMTCRMTMRANSDQVAVEPRDQ
jgi:hypothetical protein